MAPETVGDRLARAQASGDVNELRAALEDARAAGADEEYINAAVAELNRLASQEQAAEGGGAAAEASGPSPAEAAAEAAELRSRAEAFKKQGNERLKTNTKTAAREALDCFTRGLEMHCSDRVLNAQLYSNRAHVHMLLRQFVEVVDDCRKAIEMDPTYIKAYWRAARASKELDLCRNGMDFCEQGLAQEPSDADLLKLRDACAERLSQQRQRRTELASKGPLRGGAVGAGEFSADEAMALQEKVNGLGEQIDSLRISIAKKQRERMAASLTQNSLKDTPVEAPLYQGVGRCFLRQERPAVEETLSTCITNLDAELPKLSTAYQELEKRKQEAEKELQEMIDAFRRQSAEPHAAGAA